MLRSTRPVRLSHFVRTLATHTTSAKTLRLWTKEEIQEIYKTPLLDLVFRAAAVHRQHHDPSKIQLCTLMNIKSTSTKFVDLGPHPSFIPGSWWMHRRL